MTKFLLVDVRDYQRTLWAFYKEFEGQSSASFEGDLSGLNLQHIAGAQSSEMPGLERQTSEPKLDFVTIPINEKTIQELKNHLSGKGILGNDGKIIHTQIAVKENTVFFACDNFHKECTAVSDSVPKDFLDSLIDLGLIRSHGP